MFRTRVFGPAYVDLVIRVDRPLLEEGRLDGSYDGRIAPGAGTWRIGDEAGGSIVIQEKPPRVGAEPSGRDVRLSGRLREGAGSWTRTVIQKSEALDLGGMGAGFAKALRGDLVSALGSGESSDPDRRGEWVSGMLARQGIEHRPILLPGRETDWTLIVTSGPYGDKLAVGFRGCHAAVASLEGADLARGSDLLVVAGLPNPLARQALTVPARVRFLAPAMRNMTDATTPLATLRGGFDVLSCNRREWEALEDSASVLEATPLVAVTDGPGGCVLHYRDPRLGPSSLRLPAFPRDAPPRDTNRAGEAFAAAMLSALMEAGWVPGPIEADMMRLAGLRGSAASALVLDREDFGFPDPAEIDAAIRSGRVAGGGDRPRG